MRWISTENCLARFVVQREFAGSSSSFEAE